MADLRNYTQTYPERTDWMDNPTLEESVRADLPVTKPTIRPQFSPILRSPLVQNAITKTPAPLGGKAFVMLENAHNKWGWDTPLIWNGTDYIPKNLAGGRINSRPFQTNKVGKPMQEQDWTTGTMVNRIVNRGASPAVNLARSNIQPQNNLMTLINLIRMLGIGR
jgi:hypothetical protein